MSDLVRFILRPENTQDIALIALALGVLVRRKEKPIKVNIQRVQGVSEILDSYSPLAIEDACNLVTIKRTELSASQNQLDIFVLPCNSNGDAVWGAVELVKMCCAEPAKEDHHRRGGLKGKPCVGTVVRELAGKATTKETAKHVSVSRALRVALDVRETPCGEVIWRAIRRKEAVATCQSDCVAQDGATYGVSCTEMPLVSKNQKP